MGISDAILVYLLYCHLAIDLSYFDTLSLHTFALCYV